MSNRLLLAAACAATSLGCGGGDGGSGPTPPSPPSPPVSITLFAPSSVAVGGTLTATATLNRPATITWSSETPALATVDANGRITGQAPGDATIKVTSGQTSQTATVTVFPPFVDLTLGAIQACGRSAANALYCWGANGALQLGQIGATEVCFNNTPCTTTPRKGIATPVFAQVTLGYGMSCGLTAAGEVYCWGSNEFGQLGAGRGATVADPVPLPGGVRLTQLGVGRLFGCGLNAAGAAYCWGVAFPSYGNLGAPTVDVCGTFPCNLAPTPVAGGLTFASLSVGQLHACGLTATGEAYCWGSNGAGQIGNGLITAVDGGASSPQPVAGGLRFASISAGEIHTCGLTLAGQAFCWGDNSTGQIGTGNANPHLVPAQVVDNRVFVSIRTGGSHTCALTNAGAAFCWGFNDHGQVGDGTEITRSRPTAVARNLTFVQLEVRRQFACGRTAAGQTYCWGQNLYGQLGVGEGRSEVEFLVPTGVGGVP
ncbi:MAG: Ig-like domain-containing protein [Gemmatimonadales bacterium]